MNYLRIYENFINSNLLYCIQTKKHMKHLKKKNGSKRKLKMDNDGGSGGVFMGFLIAIIVIILIGIIVGSCRSRSNQNDQN